MNKVIRKQQAAQPCNGLERLRKQDISDPTTSYSVSLTNIPLVALSSLHRVYAQSQIQINNNPVPRQSCEHELDLPIVQFGQQRQRAGIFFITLCNAAAVNSSGRRFNSTCCLLKKCIWRTQRPLPSRGGGVFPEDNSSVEECAPQRSFESGVAAIR
jgi:hypothetical protein